MPHDPKKLLYDMKAGAERIERFVAGKSFEDFLKDEMLQSAVDRQFTIIGEAMSRLRKLSPEIAKEISGQNQIVGFRNILIHDYDRVDYRITWSTILKHLPVLRREVDQLLARLDPRPPQL